MVELAVRTKLILDTVDAFILTMESPVNRRRRIALPGGHPEADARQRSRAVPRSAGLERRGPKTLDLARALVESHRDPNEGGEGDGDGR